MITFSRRCRLRSGLSEKGLFISRFSLDPILMISRLDHHLFGSSFALRSREPAGSM
jgi:hypothetical protein